MSDEIELNRQPELRFYIHETRSHSLQDLKSAEKFSFTVLKQHLLSTPSFLLIWPSDSNSKAMLGRIDWQTRKTDLGMEVHLKDTRIVRLLVGGVFKTIGHIAGVPAHAQRGMIADDHFIEVTGTDASTIKASLLESNQTILTEDYFSFPTNPDNEVELQAKDAWKFAFDVFGKDAPPMTEDQLLDSEFVQAFDRTNGPLDYGRQIGEAGGKKLWLHKVHRTKIETCIGVDLIYNFIKERRLVFVQYKMVNDKKVYYHNNDGHDAELMNMRSIPDVGACRNFSASREQFRTCNCPAFFKLCERKPKKRRESPDGVYFPVCMWSGIADTQSSLSLSDDPHLTTTEFVRFTRCGLIGSTPDQTDQILNQLRRQLPEKHKRLIMLFTEAPSPK